MAGLEKGIEANPLMSSPLKYIGGMEGGKKEDLRDVRSIYFYVFLFSSILQTCEHTQQSIPQGGGGG